MGFLLWKKKIHFDMATLKKNDISILTLDERWNKIFQIVPTNTEIKKRQERLNKLLGQESALYQEQERIEPDKKKHMGRIMSLTEEAFQKNNEKAKTQLLESKQKIEALNKRAENIENELYRKKKEIQDANFRLLEETVRHVYNIMVKSKEKESHIEREMAHLKKRMKELQAQRQNLNMDWTDVYGFFHTLLGPEELTKLDLLFLKPEVKANETGESRSNEDH